MPFRPSCIICCSDCDANGLFTSCQHFLCGRCTSRYPPGTCPRCRKPCKAVKAGSALPKEISERIAQDPLRLMGVSAQALEFQRRQDQQTLQRLREIVTTLNQSNRSMASQINAAKTERENLLNVVKRLQSQLHAQQQQQQQQQMLLQMHMKQRSPDPPADGGGGGNSAGIYGASTQGALGRGSPFRAHASPRFAQSGASMQGWLSSHATGGGGGAVTPLGWGKTKRVRSESHHNTPIDSCGAGGESTRFRLATPAITLRNALPSSRDGTPMHRMDCAAAMAAPKPLQSLLCRGS